MPIAMIQCSENKGCKLVSHTPAWEKRKIFCKNRSLEYYIFYHCILHWLKMWKTPTITWLAGQKLKTRQTFKSTLK